MGENALIESHILSARQNGFRYNPSYDWLEKRYIPLIKATGRDYYLDGAERDDVEQIARIGFWEAICDYRFDRNVSFAFFAKICIRRRIASVLKASSRLKNVIFNTTQSLDQEISSEGETLEDLIVGDEGDYYNRLGATLREGEIIQIWRRKFELSDFETQVITFWIQGYSYKEIAEMLGCKYKSVDNALSRVRRRARELGFFTDRRLRW